MPASSRITPISHGTACSAVVGSSSGARRRAPARRGRGSSGPPRCAARCRPLLEERAAGVPRSSAAPRSGRCAPATVPPALIRRSGATRRAPRPRRLRARPMRRPPRSVVPRPRARRLGARLRFGGGCGCCGCCGRDARIRLRLGAGLRLGPQAGSPRRSVSGSVSAHRSASHVVSVSGSGEMACVVRRRLLVGGPDRRKGGRLRCALDVGIPCAPGLLALRRRLIAVCVNGRRLRGPAPEGGLRVGLELPPVLAGLSHRRRHRRPATPRPGGAAAIGSSARRSVRAPPRRSVPLRRSARAPPRRRAAASASAIGAGFGDRLFHRRWHRPRGAPRIGVRRPRLDPGCLGGLGLGERLGLGFGRRHRLRLDGRRLE